MWKDFKITQGILFRPNFKTILWMYNGWKDEKWIFMNELHPW
jgi:hypothetical protein